MYRTHCCKCIKQQIYKENTKHTLLAQGSSPNKARQAETHISSQKVRVAYSCAFSLVALAAA